MYEFTWRVAHLQTVYPTYLDSESGPQIDRSWQSKQLHGIEQIRQNGFVLDNPAQQSIHVNIYSLFYALRSSRTFRQSICRNSYFISNKLLIYSVRYISRYITE